MPTNSKTSIRARGVIELVGKQAQGIGRFNFGIAFVFANECRHGLNFSLTLAKSIWNGCIHTIHHSIITVQDGKSPLLKLL